MSINEKGVKANSYKYFHTPSPTGANVFYYPIAAGHFYCDTDYSLERLRYDSFLILFVVSGSIHVSTGGKTFHLTSENVILIDCFNYHKYYADRDSELYWIHFDGQTARAFFEMLADKNETLLLLDNSLYVKNKFNNILSMFSSAIGLNEAVLSKNITDILTLFCRAKTNSAEANREQILDDVISYIYTHIEQPLSLEELAAQCTLSPYYFTRIFKQKTGYTPHQFIIQCRMNQAKYFLCTTDHSIKTIGYKCGFENNSCFCTCFKKINGVTPESYRKQKISPEESAVPSK